MSSVQKVLKYHQNVRVLDCYAWWTCFSTDSRHPYGYQRAPLLADLFHYSHKVDFTQEYLKKNEKKLAQSFNFTFHCIDDVFLLYNSV